MGALTMARMSSAERERENLCRELERVRATLDQTERQNARLTRELAEVKQRQAEQEARMRVAQDSATSANVAEAKARNEIVMAKVEVQRIRAEMKLAGRLYRNLSWRTSDHDEVVMARLVLHLSELSKRWLKHVNGVIARTGALDYHQKFGEEYDELAADTRAVTQPQGLGTLYEEGEKP